MYQFHPYSTLAYYCGGDIVILPLSGDHIICRTPAEAFVEMVKLHPSCSTIKVQRFVDIVFTDGLARMTLDEV